MAGGADDEDKALREWLAQVLSGHGFDSRTAGCGCGWSAPSGTATLNQEPWLAHRTDVILDVLEFTSESRQAHAAEWERLAAGIRPPRPR
ncbi:hypothetical protein ACPPVT_00385 [Angustibacter sp. McL0619]|uniref:hypothetical protein n=1 Tax=Angustibacter sp. McL0619 TaxID=3415676 RepID=UPI003CF27DED